MVRLFIEIISIVDLKIINEDLKGGGFKATLYTLLKGGLGVRLEY